MIVIACLLFNNTATPALPAETPQAVVCANKQF